KARLSTVGWETVDDAADVARPVYVDPGARAAVSEFKSLVERGEIAQYFEAAIAPPEALNADPDLHALSEKANALFARLPTITDGTSPQAMQALGFWTEIPRGLDILARAPRYIPGRQVLVET